MALARGTDFGLWEDGEWDLWSVGELEFLVFLVWQSLCLQYLVFFVTLF